MFKKLVARAVYYPTLGFNVLLARWLKVRNWWDDVNSHCILGAVPLGNDPDRLKELGVTGVINMCEEYSGPQERYRQLGIEQLWLPTTDFHHPTREMVIQGADFLERHRRQGGRVYVHCKAGRARSATIVLWWLVRYDGLTPLQAQQQLVRVRPHVNSQVFRRPVIQELVRELAISSSNRSSD